MNGEFMAKRTGPTNVYMRKLIEKLEKTKVSIWEDVAEKLKNARRRRVQVNVSDIGRHAEEKETVVVPGVVLGAGEIAKHVDVAAWRFSNSAAEKIEKAKGHAMSIEELLEKNPKGSKVKIMI